MTLKLYPITALPGLKRDGTPYSNNYYIDGQWVRFQRNLPRKIGGYKQLIGTLPYIIRGLYVEPVGSQLNVYIGDQASVKYLPLDQFGNVTGALVDRTPAGFIANANYQWKFDTMFVSTNNANMLFAYPCQNLADIDSTINTPIYYGLADMSAPMMPTGMSVSGGIVALAPYLVMYGNDGTVMISNINDPTTLLATTRVTSQKIVQGKQVRGGNSSPAALLWSLDSVVRMTQAGVNDVISFRYDTLTDESSILSSNSVIEYDSRYFWIGVDKFYIYNGVVQELPNDLNHNYFFTNLNYQYRQKIWATKVPLFGEIWWFYPHGNATECNHAIIFNVKQNTWYDTAIHRSSGYYPQVFPYPIWADNIASASTYSLWMHETGYDQVQGNVTIPIESYFETADISWCAVDPSGQWNGTDRWVNLVSIEPDFATQVGTMQLTVHTKDYAQANTISYGTYALTPGLTKQDLQGGGVQGRFMTLLFFNDDLGGNYQLGQTLLLAGIGDARRS